MVAATVMGRSMTDVRSLGIWVRMRRESMNMTQKDLAAAIGRDPSWLSQWERGAVGSYLPDPDTLERLADALGSSVPELLRLSGYIRDEGATEPSPEMVLFTSLAESVVWDQLSEDVKAMIRRDLELARDLSRKAGPH